MTTKAQPHPVPLLLAVLLLALLSACSQPGASTAGAATEGEAAAAAADHPPPDFRLATLEGEKLGPPDFEGEVVVLDFWATWCGPCRLQAEYIEELHAELDGKGVRFLAVNVAEDVETVREFVAETPFPYPVLLDSEDVLTLRYNLLGLPTVMIVNREGAISFLRTGVTDTEQLREELRKAGAEV